MHEVPMSEDPPQSVAEPLDRPSGADGRVDWWQEHRYHVAWGVVSLVLFAWILFGRVDAHIWRIGRKHVESRSIIRTWIVQADALPASSPGWLVPVLFVGALAVFLAAVVVAFRLLLAPEPGADWHDTV
jgi:hypothetical protein